MQTIWAYSELIGRAANETPPTVQDVGVDHCRFHALMAEQFMDGSDVVAVFDEMCYKGEPISGIPRQLGEASTADGPPDGPRK